MVASDAALLGGCVTSLCEKLGVEAEARPTADHSVEMTRYGNGEIHTIGAIIGGVASQEAIKLITQQYTILNNTFVFNGIASIGAYYEM